MLSRMIATGLIGVSALTDAATFTVDSTGDDGSVGTLRWAIQQHNANPGTANEIELASSLAGQTIVLDTAANGQLDTITDGTLTVDGIGAAGAVVDGGGSARIFKVSGSVQQFTLRGFAVRNASGAGGGACLRADAPDAAISLDTMTFTQCQAASTSTLDGLGGAVHVDFNIGDGTLSIGDSVFRDNRAEGATNLVFGGAVYVENGGTHSVSDSRFEANTVEDLGSAFEAGGAIYAQRNALLVSRSEFIDNRVPAGFAGAVAVEASTGTFSGFNANLFARNESDGVGAALWYGAGGSGQPTIQMINNTFYANTTDSSTGGAVYLREASAELRNNTFVANQNTSTGGGAAHLAYNADEVTFDAVWNNALGPADTVACDTASGDPPVLFNSAGYNLLPDSSCAINGTGDIVDAFARFLPPGDYGGSTRTVPLAGGNPGVDGANPAAPDNIDPESCWETDARATARSGDGNVDGISRCSTGAFEWQQEAPQFVNGFEESI